MSLLPTIREYDPFEDSDRRLTVREWFSVLRDRLRSWDHRRPRTIGEQRAWRGVFCYVLYHIEGLNPRVRDDRAYDREMWELERDNKHAYDDWDENDFGA